jgi:hypothetical protein
VHIVTALLFSLLANPKKAREMVERGLRGGTIPTFRGIIEVKHVLERRIRFSVPSVRGRQDRADLLTTHLPKIPGVTDVRADTRTGSVVVCGEDALDGGFLVAAIARLLDLEQAIDEQPRSRLMEGMREGWRTVDRALYERTNGVLTVQALVGLVLAGGAVRQIVRTRSLALPASFTLLWWLYHLTYPAPGRGRE